MSSPPGDSAPRRSPGAATGSGGDGQTIDVVNQIANGEHAGVSASYHASRLNMIKICE
jgi:hypothetical protein